MRVLVTGIAGLYGLHLTEKLVVQPNISQVFGVDDFSRGCPGEEEFRAYPWGQKVELIKEMFQDLTVRELNSFNVEVVIHLAGYNSSKESMNTPEEYFLNNEYGTFQLMQTLLRTKNRPYLIYPSTTKVYGEPVYIPVDERHPVEPQNVFAVTKLAAEQHVMAAGRAYNYPVTALRFTNTYGENQNYYGYTSVVVAFIERALKNEPLIIYGSGEQMRDFIYVSDAVEALAQAAANRHAAEGLVINIATGHLISICDLAEKIKKLSGSRSEIIKLPAEKKEPARIMIETKLACKTLAWSPQYGLDEGLGRSICWYKKLTGL